jgi:RNA polymerase sigma-70 factor (ECF subfamily)
VSILAFLARPASGVAAPDDSVAAGSAESPLGAVDRAMARYADGDEAAFQAVFSELGPRLRLFLQRMGCAADVAEDLLQETFLRMHHARGSFARGKLVAPWAYSIARNCFISHTRSAKTRMARASVDADNIELPVGAGSSVEEESMARQTAQVVSQVLASLTPARREAFVLLRYEGMSVAAAAQIVGISEGALKIRAFHAYEALRAALARMEAPLVSEQDKSAGTASASGNQQAAET